MSTWNSKERTFTFYNMKEPDLGKYKAKFYKDPEVSSKILYLTIIIVPSLL